LVFFLFTFSSGLLVLPFTYYGYYYCMRGYKNAPKDYRYPLITDLKDIMIVSPIILFILVVSGNLFYYIFIPCSKGKGDPKEVDMRCTKAGNTLAKCFYMCFSTAVGYYVMKDGFFYPVYLGGSGDYSKLFLDHPYTPHVPYLKEYYILSTSYHFGQLMKHVLGKRQNDFVEMMLHHTVTIYLLVGSYLYNVWECGAIISYIHDASDIFGHLTKCLG